MSLNLQEKTILDLILTPNHDLVKNILVREHFSTSDHKIVSFKIMDYNIKPKKEKIYVREFSKSNFLKLNHKHV